MAARNCSLPFCEPIGAVLSLEGSRLTRNERDWHALGNDTTRPKGNIECAPAYSLKSKLWHQQNRTQHYDGLKMLRMAHLKETKSRYIPG